MTYLASVTHDIKSNTIEATWKQDTEQGTVTTRCHNYSPSQREMFINEVPDYDKWLGAAGWTFEFCAAFKEAEEKAAAEIKAKAIAEAEAAEQQRALDAKAAFDAEVARQVQIMKAAQEIMSK